MSFCSDNTEGPKSCAKASSIVSVEDVKEEWNRLWFNRIDDKVRAEGIANVDYRLLFVECGTVISATRGFKPLDLREILSLHKVQNLERIIPPDPSVGGWGKFSRTVLNKQKRHREWKEPASRRSHDKNQQQLKKGGRGWLHAE